MPKFFEIRFLSLAAVKLPSHPFFRIESRAESVRQASAVAADGFNARPVLVDDDAVIVDGVDTYRALRENAIDRVKVLQVGGASEQELRALHRAIGLLPNLGANVERLREDLECLLDAGYPIRDFIAGVVELLEALLESYGLPDAASHETWES